MSEPAASTGDAASGRVAAAALIEAMVQDSAGTQRVKGRYPEGTGFLRSALNEPWIVSRGLAANLVPRDPKHADPWRTPASHRKDAIVLEWLLRLAMVLCCLPLDARGEANQATHAYAPSAKPPSGARRDITLPALYRRRRVSQRLTSMCCQSS